MSDEITVVESSPQPVQEAPKPETPEAAKPDVPRAPDGKFAPREEPAKDPVDPPPAETAQPEKKVNKTTEFIDRLKQENRELRQMKAEWEAWKASQPKPEAPKPPNPDTFYQDPLAFVQQSNQHAVYQAQQAWQEQQEAARQAEEQERISAGFRTKAAEFALQNPDFAETLESVPADLLPDDLARTIIAHERGVELAYHLAKNWGELAQLASVAPQYQRYAIDALVSRLDTRPTAAHSEQPHPAVVAPAKPVTRAPAPVTTLSGSPSVNKSYEDLSVEEYDQRRTKERRERGLR